MLVNEDKIMTFVIEYFDKFKIKWRLLQMHLKMLMNEDKMTTLAIENIDE